MTLTLYNLYNGSCCTALEQIMHRIGHSEGQIHKMSTSTLQKEIKKKLPKSLHN